MNNLFIDLNDIRQPPNSPTSNVNSPGAGLNSPKYKNDIFTLSTLQPASKEVEEFHNLTALENKNLEHTNLEHTNLEHTNLEHTNLEHTNLEHTNLEHTNLEHKNIIIDQKIKDKYEKEQNEMFEKNVQFIIKVFKDRLNNKTISKENISRVVISGLLALMKLKNNTFDQKKKIVIVALEKYLENCESIDYETKQDLLLTSETILNSSGYIYEEISNKKCCTLL
jgi:hypothetical protein